MAKIKPTPAQLNNTEKAAALILSGKSKKRGLARILPFMGPAFVASVAYMDPGNFATNLQAGAQYGYMLLWVVVTTNLMAMLMIVAGNGTSRLEMHYLDLDSGVQVEEPVLSSGMTALFPKGIRIGRIDSIRKDKDGLHLVAELVPYASFSKLKEVLCIVSSLPG